MTHRKERLLGPSTPNCMGHCASLGRPLYQTGLNWIERLLSSWLEPAKQAAEGCSNATAMLSTDRGWPEKKQFPSTVQKHPKLHKPDHNGLRFLKFDYLDCLDGITKAKNYLSIDLHDEVEESDDVPFSGMKSGAPSWICVDLSYPTMKIMKLEFAFVSSLPLPFGSLGSFWPVRNCVRIKETKALPQRYAPTWVELRLKPYTHLKKSEVLEQVLNSEKTLLILQPGTECCFFIPYIAFVPLALRCFALCMFYAKVKKMGFASDYHPQQKELQTASFKPHLNAKLLPHTFNLRTSERLCQAFLELRIMSSLVVLTCMRVSALPHWPNNQTWIQDFEKYPLEDILLIFEPSRALSLPTLWDSGQSLDVFGLAQSCNGL